jgi:hypothetical protein
MKFLDQMHLESTKAQIIEKNLMDPIQLSICRNLGLHEFQVKALKKLTRNFQLMAVSCLPY